MDKSSLITIESEFISATISLVGAELKSLLDLESSVEYIWQEKKAISPISSLFCFPVVGKLKDDKYRIGRKYHQMQKNGFAKDMKFHVKSQMKDQVSLSLSHDNDTLSCYPFMFNLVITFTVYGPKLSVSLEVKNMDKKEMLFSLGYGTVFNVPLSVEALEDYYLEFSNREERGAYNLDNDLVNFEHVDNKKILNDKRINFNYDLFKHGELVFRDLSSSSIALKNRVSEKSIAINFESVPYISFRSFPGANFVQITPSFGVTDATDTTGDLLTKEGIIDLEQEKTFKMDMVYHIR